MFKIFVAKEESDRDMQVFMEKSDKDMQDFKAEMRASRIEMNKQWGDLANKMGTLAEDVAMPNMEPLAEKYFGMKETPDPSIRREFDIIIVYKEHVFLNEAISSPRLVDIDRFTQIKADFFGFFPEYSDMDIVNFDQVAR